MLLSHYSATHIMCESKDHDSGTSAEVNFDYKMKIEPLSSLLNSLGNGKWKFPGKLGSHFHSNFEKSISGVRNEWTDIYRACIVTGNARNYPNDVLPVISQFPCAAHGICLQGLIHPETARGISLFDAHFSVAMRKVHQYIRESGNDVCTPVQLRKACNIMAVLPNPRKKSFIWIGLAQNYHRGTRYSGETRSP